MKLRPFLCAAIVGLATLSAGSAIAEPSPSEIAVARKLFGEATELRTQKRWAKAAEKLQKVVKIKETPGVLYHLAFCEEQLGQFVEALVNYDRAAELLSKGAEADDVKALLGPARQRLIRRTPTLRILLPSDASGLEVRLDGRRLSKAVLSEPVLLNPGSHKLSVTSPRYEEHAQKVEVAEGERRKLRVKMRSRGEAPVAKKPPESPAGGKPNDDPTEDKAPNSGVTKTIVLATEGVLAVLGIGAGLFFTIQSNGATEDADNTAVEIDTTSGRDNGCTNPTPDVANLCARLVDERDSAAQASDFAVIGYVAGGVAALALIGTVVLWPSDAETASRSRFRVGAAPIPGGGAVSLGGWF